MEFSEYVKAAQGAVNYVKGVVRYRGLNTAGGWIRNPIEIPQKFEARIESRKLGTARSDEFTGSFDPDNYINQLDRLARDSNTGNCSELSAVAFNYLKSQGTVPIDYFAVWRGGWNHAFVILNRDKSQPIGDFSKWSMYAVICDPLYDRAADAGNIAVWYPKVIPLTAKYVIKRVE
jgi:hypothetical protein